MEWSKIPMLDRFDAISHIMPYYARTHKAFLLLSSLSSATRRKLDEFYYEFIEWMKDNWMAMYMGSDLMKKYIFLPLDLFTINCWLINEDNISKFIEFIKNISKSVGWYFNNKYMNSKINVSWSINVITVKRENI